jgi:hypothetical protein
MPWVGKAGDLLEGGQLSMDQFAAVAGMGEDAKRMLVTQVVDKVQRSSTETPADEGESSSGNVQPESETLSDNPLRQNAIAAADNAYLTDDSRSGLSDTMRDEMATRASEVQALLLHPKVKTLIKRNLNGGAITIDDQGAVGISATRLESLATAMRSAYRETFPEGELGTGDGSSICQAGHRSGGGHLGKC